MDINICKKNKLLLLVQILIIILNLFYTREIFLKKNSNLKFTNRKSKKDLSVNDNIDLKSFIIRKCVKENQFALTFDDGPNEMTVRHLDYFKSKKIKVTFFFMANRLLDENLLKIVKRADAEGHIIGNHNYYHTSVLEDLRKLNDINDKNKYIKEFKKYFDRSTNLFMKKLGKAPKFFRPPYGDIGYHSAKFINKLTKLKIVLWNLDSMDWYHIQEGQNPEIIIENFLDKIIEHPESSYISLQHDKGEDFEGDLERLDRILDIIKIHNFELVTLDKCLNEEPYFYLNKK